MSSNAFTATYDPQDNKLRLSAAGRLDPETYERVKAAGFRWAPKQDLFVAPAWTPQREDLLLDLCGEIGDEDSTLVDRAAERADRFDAYQANRAKDAESARAAVSAVADGIPFGQPILVGHHSEKHARHDAEKIRAGMARAVNAWRTSEYWKSRAAGALRYAKYKELPAVRARRIKTLEADLRKVTRERDAAEKFASSWAKLESPGNGGRAADAELLQKRALYLANFDHISQSFPLADYPRPEGCTSTYEGSRSLWSALESKTITPEQARDIALRVHAAGNASRERWIEHYENRLLYERAMLDEAGGTVADQVKPEKGGAVRCWVSSRGCWLYIQKVNKISVSVLDNWGNGGKNFKQTVEFDKLQGVKSAAEVAELRAAGQLVEVRNGEEPAHGFHVAEETPAPPPAPVSTPEPQAEAFRALEDQLKAGVQVVVAPQLFPTPRDLARRMVNLADKGGILSGRRVLEPSAGTGNLVGAVQDNAAGADCVQVVAVEVNAGVCSMLKERRNKTVGARETNFDIRCADFLALSPEDLGSFHAVVMNPPFSNGADVAHIQHALTFLRPGGRLVALCANGPRQRAALQPLADLWEDLPAGTFKPEGTGVNVALLVIQR